MTDFPRSLLEFQRRFCDDAACAAYVAAQRWPAGFVCPACGHAKGWALATKANTFECAACRRQTSVTAGRGDHRRRRAEGAFLRFGPARAVSGSAMLTVPDIEIANFRRIS